MGVILHLPQHRQSFLGVAPFSLNTINFMTKIPMQKYKCKYNLRYMNKHIRMEAFAWVKVVKENSFSCFKPLI